MKNKGKKKIVLIVIAILVILGVIGSCGKGGNDTAIEPPKAEQEATDQNAGEDAQAEQEEPAAEEPAEEPAGEEPAEKEDDSALDPDFKKTMDDYEAFFDHYCEVMKAYQEDPSDMEVLTEMTGLLSEETEMLEQMNNMDQSEMNEAELAYYLKVTARIEKKLLEVAY